MKKKHNSKFLFAGLIAVLGFITMGTAFAGKAVFQLDIPRAQGYAYTTDGNGNGTVSNNATNAVLENSGMTQIEAVTFYAGAYGDNGAVWNNSGTVVYASQTGNKHYDIYYGYSYGKGQKMGLRVRNHSWSLNAKGTVTGLVNYN